MISPILNDIYLSLRGQLVRAVARIVPHREVEDIVQETFVRLCLLDSSKDIQHPRSYLLKTARNLALDHVKRAESRLSDPLEDHEALLGGSLDPLADETYTSAVANEQFGLFCEAVRHLPTACRRAFVLKKVYGYSQREIAQELGLSESTVEKHIAQGIKRCKYFMARHTMPVDSGSKNREVHT